MADPAAQTTITITITSTAIMHHDQVDHNLVAQLKEDPKMRCRTDGAMPPNGSVSCATTTRNNSIKSVG